MTSRERVEAALRLDVADRPPVGAWNHLYLLEWDPARLAAATLERARRFGWDYVKFQPRATCFAEAMGGVYRPSGNDRQGPLLVSRPVTTVDDWAGLGRDMPSLPAPLAQQVGALQEVARALGPGVPVVQTVFSPITVATYLVGGSRARVLRDLAARPDLVLPALARVGEVLAEFGRRSLEAGAAGVFYAVSGYAAAGAMTARAYREAALPLDRAVVRAFGGGWFNILHLCGSRLHFSLSRELPVQAVSWSAAASGNPSLAGGRELSGKAVLGGVGQKTTLVTGRPAQVEAEVKAAVRETGGRGLLVGPGCSVSPWAPEENLERMARAVA
ncbi:MAG: uroporphyrinogen decarboxylase family protein [Candidatus Dormibacterales bacterium]